MIAEAVKHMLAAGMPHDAIVAAVADMESTMPAVDTRSKGAIRTQRWRDNKALQNVTERHTVTEVTEASPTPSLNKESFPHTPFKEIKPNPVCDTRARGSRIPADWTPAKPLPANVKALTDQWPPGRYERELDGFRDYWTSRQRNAAMLDWDKGWWNRIRSQHDSIIRQVGNGRDQRYNGQSRTGYGRTADAIADFIREAEGGDASHVR